MSEERRANEGRRRFLKIAGSGAALVPIIGLAGCSGGNDSAPAAASKPMTDATTTAKDAAKSMETEAKSATAEMKAAAPTAEMPKLAMDDPQAKSLSYVEDATSIDSAKQPRHQAGQACANCALFQDKDGAEWAGCSIFPGKLVSAAGWCSVYAPRPA